MSLSVLLNELRQICAELGSEKISNRNKALDRLDNILTNSKDDLIRIYGRSVEKVDPTWGQLFNSSIDAALLHAEKVQEAHGTKVFQTLRNRNHLYSSIINKLIDYSLEDNNNFLIRPTILNAFFTGFSNRTVVKNFGKMFLQILDRGIYESPENTSGLKVNELSRIISFLFEVNVPDDETLKLAVLRCINRTIELCQQYVQLGFDFKDYLEEIKAFAMDAEDEHKRAEVIKLFYLFISELSVDYHISVCGHIQEILPVLCGFYNFRMKPESKTFFFRGVYSSLNAIYPNLSKGDYNTICVSIDESWSRTLRKLRSIVDMEAKEQTIQLQRPAYQTDVCLNIFVKMSAMIVYLASFCNSQSQQEPMESRAKVPRNSDQLDTILALTRKDNKSINQIWMEIFTELIATQPHLINPSNYVTILDSLQRSLHIFNGWQSLKCLRLGFATILKLEPTLFLTMRIESQKWTEIVEFLIADTSSNLDVFKEKHMLLHELIRANKLRLDDCVTLLNFFLSSNGMRRNESIITIREIMRYHENCNVDKTSDLIGKLLTWLYQPGKIDSMSILLDNAPLDKELIADTSALMVINFLDSPSHELGGVNGRSSIDGDTELLNYKYCREYICIKEHGKELRQTNAMKTGEKSPRCVIQNNYELLMRLLNLKNSNEANMCNIERDLSSVLKMVLLLRKFFDYGIFNESTYISCPLVKRIGFFFDNLDFQLKSISVDKVSYTELLGAIETLLEIFNNICACSPFLKFFTTQSNDGLIAFAGCTLKLSESNRLENDSKELSNKTLKLLALLCSSSEHAQMAFTQIKQQRLNIKDNISGILTVTKIFCQQPQNHEIAIWCVDKLKTICQLYHTNVAIAEQIIDMIAEIVRYVEPYPDELQLTFIMISSFLKIAFKKSYSAHLAAKLIKSIRQIVKYCPNLITSDDFVSICLSSAKFLSSPNIAIAFAAVMTVSSLLDSKWVSVHATNMDKYFNFCCTLYSHLDWNGLAMDSDDVKKNSTGVTIQLLTFIFAFSSFHREVAFKELGNYCATQTLNEGNFYHFGQIAAYYGCSLSDFTKPYVDALLCMWSENKYPVDRFPYFLCEENKDKYVVAHLPSICYYHLRFSPAEGLEQLQALKYGKKQQLLSKALPVCYAYLLSALSGNSQHPAVTYATEAKALLQNLKNVGCDIVANTTKLSWTTIYNAAKQLWDECHFFAIFGIKLYINSPTLSINFVSLKHIMRFYLQNCYRSSGTLAECVLLLMKSDAMVLLNVLAAFKLEASDFTFTGDKLKAFYWFCSLSEIVIETISNQFATIGLDSTQTFFLRDILFFVLNTIGDVKVEADILKAGLHFIYHVLEKNISTFAEIIKKYLNDIACVVVSITQNSEPSNVHEMAINLLELLICQHTKEFYESVKLLDKFPDSDMYQNLRSVQRGINKSRETELRWVVQDFLRAHTKGSVGLRSLKQCIADKKSEFEDLSLATVGYSNLLYDLLKRLIDIVREDDLSLATESAKCLGEIGSIKVADISFYFECDTTFYNMESSYRDEMEFFAESFYRLLDKLLLRYDSDSCVQMYAVCKDLVNSRVSSNLLGSFSTLSVFLEQGHTSMLDRHISIAAFSFIDILKQHEHLAYNKWVGEFSSNVFRQCQWESFAELCELNLSFSESSIIPVFKMLLANRQTHFDNIVAMLDQFFQRTFEAINTEEWKTSKSIYSDKRVIKYFLNICECIRIHNNWNVPINILHVAKACIYCQAHFMGILYLEMWALKEKDKPMTRNTEIIRDPIFQAIATEAFKSIDCAEAISGFLDPLTSRLEYLDLEGDWSQVLLEIDASNDLNKSLYVQNLKRNGLLMLSSSDKFSDKLDYECCWRLGQWDTAVERTSKMGTLIDLEYEFEKNHFNALKSIHNKEEVNCMAAIDKARQAVILILKEISIECLQSIYKYLTWLHLLQQAEDFCQLQFALGTHAEGILQKWNVEQALKYGNFYCTELVLSHQMTLYKTAGVRAGRKINEFFKDKSAMGECILKCINECKNAGNINLAIRNIALLRNIETSEQLKAKALIEDAEICSKTGKTRMAKEILHNVMLNKDFVYCLERIQAHRMYGELLLETNNETFDVVYEEFFIRSIELLNKYSEHRDKVLKSSSFDINEFEAFNRKSRKLAFATIANYADKEYIQLNTYLNSETFRTKVQIMMKNREEAQTLARQSKDRDKSIGINVMLRNCNIDDKEIKMLQVKRSDNLCIAMENYIQFCKLDDGVSSHAVYRIIALWFANKHDVKLHSKIKEIIHEIPSYKFLCVLNQMSARLSSKNPEFLKLIEAILVKCIEDHPHHTLHKIFALVFAYADDPKSTSTHDRVTIAKNIINKAKNKASSTCIKQMESMFSALIDFANKDAGKSSSLLLSDKIKKLKNLDHVQCPTMDLPIAINKEYTPTYVRKWEENVALVGGINAPKKLMCVCSDGVARPQLLKGKDDLRQDAVMQQVLSMVNELLKTDPETNDQKLLLRTYRIVPLSMRSGILEWCKNTVPLGMYLCGDKKTEGAHKKYRPKDYTVSKCRTLSMTVITGTNLRMETQPRSMLFFETTPLSKKRAYFEKDNEYDNTFERKRVQDALKKQDFDHRLEVYNQICEKIKPVFHYFFFEKFLVPGVWFERRLAYTKSVATTSIVGFILGLGDRHVQNILIDELTAEVIHIDFGIAFEQGKIMPTPETVPFRLTRDIVAPMGISEADGVFRKACEKTMKILRKNNVFLTTILEVLLYDPLYVWKWSSQKTLDSDKDGDNEGKNLTAQRALLRVQDKLEGKEEGKMGTPNVEVQIQRLINEAMNVHNLCRLYPGWDPYL